MNVSNCVFYRNLSAFRPLVPIFADVSGLEDPGNLTNVMLPAFLAQPLQPAAAHLILEGFAMLIGKMRQIHRRYLSLHDQGGAESSAEAKKQHPAIVVAP
jgi:hypothetical protein